MKTALLLLTLLLPSLAIAQPSFRPELLRPGIDSLAVYFVNGSDTTRTGLVMDELTFSTLDGSQVIRRVYRSLDRVMGVRLDTLVDDASSLAPLLHRSRASNGIEAYTFADGRVTGWKRLANGDSVGVSAPVPIGVINASTVDLALRSSPLAEGWSTTIHAFMPDARTLASLPARVVSIDTLYGEAAYRVAVDFAGLSVTFWIGQDARRLLRQVMQLRPDRAILFARPAGTSASKRAT